MELLPCAEIEPRVPATASVVWLHGLGASGDDFVPIVPMLKLPHVRFVFPQAPDRRVTINGGYLMPSWYDIKSLGFRGQEREDMGQLAASSAAVEALIAREVARGVPASRVGLAGFSQGGAVALHVGNRPGHTLAGIMALSTYLVHGDAERVRGAVETPLLGMHGRELMAVADMRIMRGARQETIVAGGDEAVRVLTGRDDDATDMQALAAGTGTDEYGGGHEVFIP